MAEQHEEEGPPAPKRLIVERLPEDRLRAMVFDILEGRVFTSHQCDPDLLSSVFMPIAFGCLADYPKEDIEQLGTIYEYMQEAGPRSINGFPMFFSCRFIHRDDWKIIAETIVSELDRRKNVPLGKPEPPPTP